MKKKLLALITILSILLTSMSPVQAAVNYKSGYAYKTGKNVYYAFTTSSSSTAIYRINVKTKKKTKIFPKNKVTGLSDFCSLNVQGGYVYCCCSVKSNFIDATFIYRIKISNGKIKRLATGINPTIVGDKIVYEQTKNTKVSSGSSMFMSVPTGKIKEMNLDGTGKKDIDPVEFKDAEASYNMSGPQKTIVMGKSKYYISGKGKKLVAKKSGRKKTIFKSKNKIIGYRVLSGYVVIKVQSSGKITAYGVKTNGKNKAKLISWKLK